MTPGSPVASVSAMDPDDDGSHAAALRAFTRFPVASVVWLWTVAVVGVAYAIALGTDLIDDGGAALPDLSPSEQLVPLVIGAGVAVVALGHLLVLLRARRRDTRAVGLVVDDRPERAEAGATRFFEVSVPGLLALAVLAVVVVGLVLLFRTADGAAWGWLTLVGLVVVALSLLMTSWRGHEYVGVHPDGIRLLRRGRLTSGPWARVQHWDSGRVGLEGGADLVGVSGETGRLIRERAVAAALAGVVDRLKRGEVVELGAVRLRQDALVVHGEVVPWGEITRVVLEHDGENNWSHVLVHGRGRRGERRRGKVNQSGIPNFPVFRVVLRTFTGLTVLDPRRRETRREQDPEVPSGGDVGGPH